MTIARVSLLVSLMVVAGCSSHAVVESDATTDESLDALVGATCREDEARRVDVALEGSACSDVKGSRGNWIARPLFPDAPEEVRAQSCRFTWQGSGGSAPDRTALENDVEGVMSPTCARGRAPAVVPIDASDDPPIIIHGGSIGCDVCGKNRDRNGWIVVPPGERYNRRLLVTVGLATVDGTTAEVYSRYRVAVPKNASALTVTFPRPPSGLHYMPDTLHVGGF